MKRFLGLILILLGIGLIGWAAPGVILPKHQRPFYYFGYDAMYPGLVGIAVLTAGVIFRQD